MKKLIIILMLCWSAQINAQAYDLAMQQAARSMARQLNANAKLNVAIYPFYDRHKQQTQLSRMMSEDFAVNLSQYRQNFKIIDRNYLEQMMAEHHLNEEGLIDPRTAKKFGMIIAADAYITGKILLMGTHVRLNVFAIDTETGERIASLFKRIPLDQELADFLGIKNFRQQLKRQELYRSSNPDCATQGVGDMCFVNKTNKTLNLQISESSYSHGAGKRMSLQPGERKCFNDLKAGKTYRYKALPAMIIIGDIVPKGMFRVKTCESDVIMLQ